MPAKPAQLIKAVAPLARVGSAPSLSPPQPAKPPPAGGLPKPVLASKPTSLQKRLSHEGRLSGDGSPPIAANREKAPPGSPSTRPLSAGNPAGAPAARRGPQKPLPGPTAAEPIAAPAQGTALPSPVPAGTVAQRLSAFLASSPSTPTPTAERKPPIALPAKSNPVTPTGSAADLAPAAASPARTAQNPFTSPSAPKPDAGGPKVVLPAAQSLGEESSTDAQEDTVPLSAAPSTNPFASAIRQQAASPRPATTEHPDPQTDTTAPPPPQQQCFDPASNLEPVVDAAVAPHDHEGSLEVVSSCQAPAEAAASRVDSSERWQEEAFHTLFLSTALYDFVPEVGAYVAPEVLLTSISLSLSLCLPHTLLLSIPRLPFTSLPALLDLWCYSKRPSWPCGQGILLRFTALMTQTGGTGRVEVRWQRVVRLSWLSFS